MSDVRFVLDILCGRGYVSLRFTPVLKTFLRFVMAFMRSHPILLALIGLCAVCWPDPGRAERPRKLNIVVQAEAFGELADLVRRQYYEETDPVDLYHGAIEGYLSRLGPHSTYITPDELQDTQDRLKGSFEGIGIYFDIIDHYLTVLSPIEGAPAYRVGLLSGDRIVKIDGRSAVGIKVSEVTRRLKGPKGSRVNVSVQREGEDDLLEFEIVRDKIEVPSVPYGFKIAPDVGYVKINRFAGHTARELRSALKQLKKEGIQKLVLDLRGNGGGYLEQAVTVADQFLEKDRLVVYTRGRHTDSRENHYAEQDPLISPDTPLLVLVNGYSASASEIVAGAIQDYDRGLIVGRTTFGKGLVQKQFPLKNGGAVLLTIARYFTPSDRPIQRPFSRDRQAYMEAGYDDYDPNADPDSVAAKPIYYTRILHRKVFGSGGVTPDVTLKPDSLSAFEKRLTRSHFFEFANRHSAEITRDYSDFEHFFNRYQPGRRRLSSFKQFLKDRDVVFTDREFKKSVDLIKRGIKQKVAQIRWGSRAAGRVQVSGDPEVVRALALFDEAKSLLASRTYHYNRGRTHVPAPAAPRNGRMR